MLDINKKGNVFGEEIHKKIESKLKDYSIWVKRAINYADLKIEKDFSTRLQKSTGGRPKTQYEFTLDAAKEICLLEKNAKGKEIRRWLIKLAESHETGLSFTSDQIYSLIDLSKSMTLISIQKEVEKRHFDIYNDKYTWYDYRANLLGYSTKSVISAMQKVNKKHKSIRKSLVKLDANELIRTGVIDFFIALGKDEIYAKNAGNLCKKFASEMKLGNQIWDDTKENPLQLNKKEINSKKELFNQYKILDK